MSSESASQLKKLNVLIGKWKTLGEEKHPDGTSTTIQGTDQYEWVAGGQFLKHQVNVMMGNKKVETIELIGGFEESSQTFYMRSFDNEGQFSVMHLIINKDNSFTIKGDKMLSVLTVSHHEMKAHWKKSEDNLHWIPWMELTFERINY